MQEGSADLHALPLVESGHITLPAHHCAHQPGSSTEPVSRVFIGAPLGRPDWLHHWPCFLTQSSVLHSLEVGVTQSFRSLIMWFGLSGHQPPFWSYLRLHSKSSHWHNKDIPIAWIITRVFEALCQEPGTKISYILYFIISLNSFVNCSLSWNLSIFFAVTLDKYMEMWLDFLIET